MTISGFTMVRNATKLYYPIRQAICSILPIVDEFIVALGDCDPDDRTLEEIESIGSDKIRIIHTVWDLERYPSGMEHAHQTDIAKKACKGDWLFYIQSDEVVHEKDLPLIRQRCEELLPDTSIEGLLFKYRHFWGDYDHYMTSHAWYANEIRIIRNLPEIHSWESAQSFRRIPDFDGLNYRQKKGTYKLKVARVDAFINHYGWVRPPRYMQQKRKAFATIHFGRARAEANFRHEQEDFHFGNLNELSVFKETHPAVMQERIRLFNWADQLEQSKNKVRAQSVRHKHEKLKYRILTFIEQNFLGGRQILSFKNYRF
ncbi:MAG TPA: glycosyltransferase family 2 protein [Puia sp.]|nr:glycosyltransferase family 2 protein [Puia sp.]